MALMLILFFLFCILEIKAEPYREWKKHLTEGPLKPLEPFFSGPNFPLMGGFYETDTLQELGEKHSACECPAISSSMIARIVRKRLSLGKQNQPADEVT